MHQYRIIKNEWFKKGQLDTSYYTVERLVKIFFTKKWKPFTEDSFLPSGIRQTPIRFRTEDQAKAFIESQIEGNPVNGKRTKVVHIYSDSPIFESIS